ncbi:MAG: 50S ribosomal protein L6 [candidate division NC10 bacterium]|nr:50S ribosomal protein L6 [candidate division NC10 bacterium]
MSRIGKLPISIPDTVKVEVEAHTVTVKGPKGTLSMAVHPAMDVRVQDRQVLCGRPSDTKFHKALHGLTRSLIANMVEGVTKGFERKLELVGVGYRAAVQGQNLSMTLGFSHPIIYPVPPGIRVEVKDPEPYKGKGVKYADERIRRKAGKTGAK